MPGGIAIRCVCLFVRSAIVAGGRRTEGLTGGPCCTRLTEVALSARFSGLNMHWLIARIIEIIQNSERLIINRIIRLEGFMFMQIVATGVYGYL